MKKIKIEDYIASVPDFPKKGILFRDVTSALEDGEVFNYMIEEFAEYAKKVKANVIAGPEARGFIFGSALAYKLNLGFVPFRKPNKLPRETISVTYDLEYGTDTLSVHKDSLKKGDKVLIVDDLLATGGTALAAAELVEKLGAEVAGFAFVINLKNLPGEEKIKKYDKFFLVEYEE